MKLYKQIGTIKITAFKKFLKKSSADVEINYKDDSRTVQSLTVGDSITLYHELDLDLPNMDSRIAKDAIRTLEMLGFTVKLT
jgi:hypothetical protein